MEQNLQLPEEQAWVSILRHEPKGEGVVLITATALPASSRELTSSRLELTTEMYFPGVKGCVWVLLIPRTLSVDTYSLAEAEDTL